MSRRFWPGGQTCTSSRLGPGNKKKMKKVLNILALGNRSRGDVEMSGLLKRAFEGEMLQER